MIIVQQAVSQMYMYIGNLNGRIYRPFFDFLLFLQYNKIKRKEKIYMKYYISITSLFTIEADSEKEAAEQALRDMEAFPLSYVNDVEVDRVEVNKFILGK